jgi:ribosomal protein S20
MKVRTIMKKMYQAILKHDEQKEKKFWLKALKKSFNHKKTYAIK